MPPLLKLILIRIGPMPPLLKLILIRIGLGVLTLFLVSIVVFVATQALPGDTAKAILGREAANVDRYEALKEQLGLNKPMAEQYLSWLGGVVTGDLGDSLAQGTPVTGLLGRQGAQLVHPGVRRRAGERARLAPLGLHHRVTKRQQVRRRPSRSGAWRWPHCRSS